MLGPHDALPARPARVLVAGTSGSGKTTVAGRIADLLQVPHVEIDQLMHGPGWEPRPTFAKDVAEFTSEPAWVTEWQYDEVRELLAARADLLVWLDLPRSVVMRQVVRRTVGRRLRREELWGGNTEPPLRAFFTDRDHIVRWAWRTHPASATRMAALREGLPVVRLRTRRETEQWLAGPLAAAARSSS